MSCYGSVTGQAEPEICQPFKVLAKVGKVCLTAGTSQELTECTTLSIIYLKKCYADEPLVMPLEGIHVDDKLQFAEEPVEIVEREIKRLKRSRIPLVKVRWNSRRGPEFTWEREDSFEGVTDWYQSQGYREPDSAEPDRAFWGADDEEVSEGSIPRVIVLGYDGLPLQPVAPPSPDYIPGPENPQTPPVPQDEDEREPMFVQAHDPNYVPEPIYPEYIPLEDDHEFLAEEQPLPPVDSPTAESPGYVTESDPEEDPEEYEDDETEDGPTLRIASTQTLIDAVTAALPPPPLLPSLYIPPPVDHRDDIPESEQPPRKRLHLSTLGSRYEIGESSTARPTRGRGIYYGFVSTVDAEERRQGIRDFWIQLWMVDGRSHPYPERLGPLDMIESCDSSGLQDPS
ncbi:hypothetical protein Tco_0002438 [Tanacetum coccineum]